MYDFDGRLVNIFQSLQSLSGKTTWQLAREKEQRWVLSVTAGGATSTRTVERVHSNLDATYAIQTAVLSGTAAKGQVWTDTLFDVMSGEHIVVKTTCTSVPASQVDTWTFVNRDNVIRRDERWEVDRQGRTVVTEVAPIFTAKREGGGAPGRTQGTTADITAITEEFIVVMERPPKTDETVAVRLTEGAALHESVQELYAKKGEEFLLKPMPRTCNADAFRSSGAGDTALLRATPTVQANDPSIRELASRLTKGGPGGCAAVRSVNDYVFEKIEKRAVATYSSALETLRAGFGDCGEHAVLVAALLRAADIPSRVVYGMVYVGLKGGYMYHAWIQVRAGSWLNVDAAMGVFPAWKGYVPLLADDSGFNTIHLANLLGRVRLRYVPAASVGLKN
jgi:transglutaminase-like putative cysteine protease